MTESPGASLPPPVEVPKKTNPWIIALVGIVVICCACFGVAGLVFGFWDPIMQAFGVQALLPLLTILP